MTKVEAHTEVAQATHKDKTIQVNNIQANSIQVPVVLIHKAHIRRRRA